jgi:hypothetical protein
MKKIIIFIVIVIAGLAAYKKFFSSTAVVDTSRFSLAKVEEKPVPKTVLFKLWKEVALQLCSDAAKNHNLTPEQCQEKVSERHSACERTSIAKAPELIGEQALSKRLGREYLECVTPYYFCKGIEVRSEEEAQKHCQ